MYFAPQCATVNSVIWTITVCKVALLLKSIVRKLDLSHAPSSTSRFLIYPA